MTEETALPERKARKSVAFSEGTTVVSENGEVHQEMNGVTDKETAESHSTEHSPAQDVIADDDMFKGLTKKKKKKPKTEGEDGAEDSPAPAADGEFDPTALKKKKKKKTVKPAEGADFEAKLAEAGVGEKGDGEDDKATAKASEPIIEDGDLEAGTGIWAHGATQNLTYPLLLSRFFTLLHNHHPDLASSGSKSYKIPPPQCLREGNKKTIFANISDICKRMKRSDEHVTQFLFAELGTSGSVDGNQRLVIKGRFQQKQLENVLKRYIVEYVTCKTCRSPDTSLSKGENRLYFVTCNTCSSRRSVTAIKSGFTAQIGKRRLKQQG